MLFNFCSECNGHPPLNNQRTLSPQNSIKSFHTLSPCNSMRGRRPVSRHNSLTSYQSCNVSRQNSFSLSRQNSFTSHRTLSPQNSLGSGPHKDDYKHNNLNGGDITSGEDLAKEEEEDPDAQDEAVCIDDPLTIQITIRIIEYVRFGLVGISLWKKYSILI